MLTLLSDWHGNEARELRQAGHGIGGIRTIEGTFDQFSRRPRNRAVSDKIRFGRPACVDFAIRGLRLNQDKSA
jgi:hypothetical protein